jgi:hypothetical protein
MQFTVSGELTVFRGENYLLATVGLRAVQPAIPAAEASKGAEPLAADAPVADVLEVLRAQQPQQSYLDSRSADAAPGRRAHRPLAPLLEGTPLVNRPGRLVASGSWWTFVFESGDLQAPEAPMKVLPNLNLELMVQVHELGAPGLVFVVSGDVTAHQGENYLLARMALQRPDLGNLRK